MPDLLPSVKQQILKDHNYPLDGSWDVVPTPDGQSADIVKAQSTQQPTQVVGHQQPGYGGSDSSATGTFARSAATGLLPTLAGSAAMAGIAAAPLTGGLSLAATVGGGLLAGGLTSYLQNKAIEKLAPDLAQQQAIDQQQHPIASLAGSAIDMMAGGFNPSPDNVLRAGGTLLKAPGAIMRGTGLGAEELANLARVGGAAGIGAGIGAGQNLVQQLQQPGPIDPMQAIKEAIQQGSMNALFNKPNIVGEKVFKFHGGGGQAPDTTLTDLQANHYSTANKNPNPPKGAVEPDMAFDLAEGQANKQGYVPFTSTTTDPKTGEVSYVRPYDDVLAAAKKVAPGIITQKHIPESPIDVPTKVVADQHSVRQKLDELFGPQPYQTGEGGLGPENRFEGGVEAAQQEQEGREAVAKMGPPNKPTAEQELQNLPQEEKQGVYKPQSPVAQEEEQAPIGEEHKLYPEDFKPALRTSNAVYQGNKGESHADIMMREARQGNADALTNPEHGFVDKYNRFQTREQASKLLGQEGRLTSQDLLVQQKQQRNEEAARQAVKPNLDTLSSGLGEYWQAPDGKFIDATRLGHAKIARGVLATKHGLDYGGDYLPYGEMYKRGYARVVHTPSEIQFEGKVNRAQKDSLMSEAVERSKKLVWDNGSTVPKVWYDPDLREQPTDQTIHAIEKGGKYTQWEPTTDSAANKAHNVPPWLDWATKLMKAAGVKRNIKVDVEGRLINPITGNSVNGLAYLRDGVSEATAKMTPKQLDTFFHEPGGHIFLDDLKNSPKASDRKVAESILEAHKNNPQYEEWAKKVGRDSKDPKTLDEFAAQHAGEFFAKHREKVTGFKANWEELKSATKLRFGDATSEDASRILHNRFFKDPDFYYTHMADKVQPNVAGSSTEQREPVEAREQPEGQSPIDETEERKNTLADVRERHPQNIVDHNDLSTLTMDNLKALRAKSLRFAKESFNEADKQYQLSEASKYGVELHRRLQAINEPHAQEPNQTIDEPNRDKVEGRLFGLTSSGIDDIRRSIPGESGGKLADALTRTYNYQQELKGKFVNAGNEIIKELTPEQRENVQRALYAKQDEQRDMGGSLRTLKEQQAYNKLNELHEKIFEERSENNQPVITSNGSYREAKRDPFHWPNETGRDQADIIRKGEDTAQIEKFHQDFLDYQEEHGEGHVTPEIAEERWSEYAGSIRGDLGQQQGKSNQAFFSGIRKAQGIGLPDSLREKDLGRAWNSYATRASGDMAWYKHIEDNPKVAHTLGYSKTGWGEPLPEEATRGPNLAGNEKVQSVLNHYRGTSNVNQFGSDARLTHSLEHLATAAIVGPSAQVIHKPLSSISQLLGLMHPSEVVGAISKGLTENSEGWKHAVQSGLAYVAPRTASDNVRMLTSLASRFTDRLGALAELATKAYTLGGHSDEVMTGFNQMASEYIMTSRVARANTGDREAARFIQHYDPDYEQGKTYQSQELQSLASRLAGTIHGAKDPRTLPNYLTKDTEISAFLKLGGWQVSAANSWMRNVYTPLTKGNFVPLLMSSLGALAGGYAIKALREKVSDSKSPVPDWSELMASDANKRVGLYGTKLEDNKMLMAYHFTELASLSGFAGIISSALKDVMDYRYKNSPNGLGSIFPLDEILSQGISTGGKVASAMFNGDTDPGTILGRGLTDLFKENVQVARIAIANAEKYGGALPEDYQRHEYNQKLGEQRRYEMASGLPYEDQSSLGNESNPYLTLGESAFKRNMNIPQALQEQLPPLIHKWMNLYADKPQVFMQKLEGLKENQYETVPNPDINPMGTASYNRFLSMTDGEKEATDRLIDYMKHHAINEVKNSALP